MKQKNNNPRPSINGQKVAYPAGLEVVLRATNSMSASGPTAGAPALMPLVRKLSIGEIAAVSVGALETERAGDIRALATHIRGSDTELASILFSLANALAAASLARAARGEIKLQRSKYPFAEMQVGDSVFIPLASEKDTKRGAIACYITKYSKRNSVKFKSKKVQELWEWGVRVERIE